MKKWYYFLLSFCLILLISSSAMLLVHKNNEEKLNVNLKLAELYECGKYDETITECNKILKKDKI